MGVKTKGEKVVVDTRKPKTKKPSPAANKTKLKNTTIIKPAEKKEVKKETPIIPLTKDSGEEIIITGSEMIKPENNTAEKTKLNLEKNFQEKEINTPINSEKLDNQPIRGLSDFLSHDIKGAENIEEKKAKINDPENPSFNSEIKNERLDQEDRFKPESGRGFDDHSSTDPDMFSNDEDDLEDTILDTMFSDHKMLAEFLVEGIDLLAISGASLFAKDFNSYEKYDQLIPQSKKDKLKKPLEALLAQRQAKADPMVVFLGMMLVIYAPVFLKAFEDRKINKMTKNEKAEILETKLAPKKKRGRPKGTKKVNK